MVFELKIKVNFKYTGMVIHQKLLIRARKLCHKLNEPLNLSTIACGICFLKNVR